MRIVGPIQFWRGCTGGRYRNTYPFLGYYSRPPIRTKKRTRSAQNFGLSPLRNISSFLWLYSRPPIRTKKRTRSMQKCWLGSLRNTSPFLGLKDQWEAGIWSCDLRANERPGSDHVTWGPMRGLEKNLRGRGHPTTRRRTLRLLDQLGPEGRVGDNDNVEQV